MNSRKFFAWNILLVSLAAFGCERDPGMLQLAEAQDDPLVFDDAFGNAATYQAFLGSKFDAVDITTAEKFSGTAALEITVPGPDDPSGTFAGGAFTTGIARSFTAYNALTFYAKASKSALINVVGIANDNTGTSRFEASAANIAVSETWEKIIIPIPLSSKLTNEQGLFFFAEGHEGGEGYTIWFDEVKYENTSLVTDPVPIMSPPSPEVNAFIGADVSIGGTRTRFTVDGSIITMDHLPNYFTFISSDANVATADASGIRTVGPGSTTITATLGGIEVQGAVVVNVASVPADAPTAPTQAPANVISLFSSAYDDVTVDTWSAVWDQADFEDVTFAGNDVKAYSNLTFAGIEFTSNQIDATGMTHFHADLWLPPGATRIGVKLVDFGADGAFGGGDDSEHEIQLTDSSTPALSLENWLSVDLPLADFTNLTSRANLAQLILTGTRNIAFVDNIYFYAEQ